MTTYDQPSAKPTAKMQAAGIAGLVAGVPLGAWLGNIIVGVSSVAYPEFFGSLDESSWISVDEVRSAVSGILTLAVAGTMGYFKRESV